MGRQKIAPSKSHNPIADGTAGFGRQHSGKTVGKIAGNLGSGGRKADVRRGAGSLHMGGPAHCLGQRPGKGR